ncbi:centrosome-associated protein CEP250 [Labrus bergylta]|uniref:centrosome-associated protein CEP250 n=1 Tax=Labrus bergylta TaxID=56723 RepID=UPI00331419D4
MEDLNDNISLTGFDPLFIEEEDADPDKTLTEQRECNSEQAGFTLSGTQLNQSSLIKPYLQEMDDLLKSCEELTGFSFGSHFSETNPTEIVQCHRKDKVPMESNQETGISPQAYLSTSYMDTNMDGAGTEDQPAQDHAQGLEQIIKKSVVATDVSQQRKMPLTSAGNKLSNSMIEYEGHLLGMLAMLEGCMEETGMDFEPQDWATDATQEYVHISTNSNLRRGTTLPIQQEGLMKLEASPLELELCAYSHAGGNILSDMNRNELAVGSATVESRTYPVLSLDNTSGFSMERLGGQGKANTDQSVLEAHLRFARPSMTSDNTQNGPTYCEATSTGCMSSNEATLTEGEIKGIEVDNSHFPAEGTTALGMDSIYQGPSMNELSALGSQMEEWIEEVQQVQKRRKELLLEVLELRGNKDREEVEDTNKEEAETEELIDSKVAVLMSALRKEEEGRREERKKEIQCLWEERAEEERRVWKVNLERQGIHEELKKLKRRLFAIARDCAHNQFALNTQHREVDALKREEEKMKSLVLELTEESAKLRAAHQQQLLHLKAEHHAQRSSQTSNTQDQLTQCKRHSCGDIQQYLQSGLKALEDRYEPIMLALLKRREVTAESLVKSKEQNQELRTKLRPLKEEIQKLILQRTCLEEKLKLTHMQRREDVVHYKERVYTLEESSRELKTELNLQKRKTKEIEELRDSLTKRLLLYRAAIKDHNCDDEQKND